MELGEEEWRDDIAIVNGTCYTKNTFKGEIQYKPEPPPLYTKSLIVNQKESSADVKQKVPEENSFNKKEKYYNYGRTKTRNPSFRRYVKAT